MAVSIPRLPAAQGRNCPRTGCGGTLYYDIAENSLYGEPIEARCYLCGRQVDPLSLPDYEEIVQRLQERERNGISVPG